MFILVHKMTTVSIISVENDFYNLDNVHEVNNQAITLEDDRNLYIGLCQWEG